MNIVNSDLSLSCIKFVIADITYRITATNTGTGREVGSAIDTIKNTKTGKVKKMTRYDLKNMLERFKALPLY